MVAGRVRAEFAHHTPPPIDTIDPALTPHQSRILTLVAQGRLYKEVAAELNLSEKTIKYHMGQIPDRLHLETPEEAIHNGFGAAQAWIETAKEVGDTKPPPG